MNDPGKSDRSVVPEKPSNKAGRPAAEMVEGSDLAKGNTNQQNALRTQRRDSRAPSALDRVREAARKDKKARFTALLHHVTVDRLRDAYQALKRSAAAGIDGETWQSYGEELQVRLMSLHRRVQCGAYRAKPSRRTYIPKADGQLRPLGIAALEDKIVQRALVDVMNAIYEVDFLGFSYGFRPGRSPHDALDALTVGIYRRKVNWVLDADIRGFFDAIDHEWLMKFVGHRIGDRRVLRLIQKWLSAGVVEGGRWTESAEGAPQGATISPLLANLYLHYVLDLWVDRWRRKHARGDVIIVRYADDFIVGFQHCDDAERFQKELEVRLSHFNLELHPEKTRLLQFGRYAAERRAERHLGKPETFAFLGFTHLCARSRKGEFLVARRTVRKRMRARLREVKAELAHRRHKPIAEQGQWLRSVVQGYFRYHAVHTNLGTLLAFRKEVQRHWFHALRRRGQRDRTSWRDIRRLAQRWLPRAEILHEWPDVRFDVHTQGKSPVR